jgi:hypothetical protein
MKGGEFLDQLSDLSSQERLCFIELVMYAMLLEAKTAQVRVYDEVQIFG